MAMQQTTLQLAGKQLLLCTSTSRGLGFANRVWDGVHAVLGAMQAKGWLSEEHLAGKRILELGAGTGTLGILLAMHGAMVDVTDLPVCCELLQWNIDANRTAFSEREEKPLRVRAVGLDWTQPLPAELRQQQQEAEEDLRYDFVVASDVLYMPRLHEPFFRTLSQITTEGTTVVLGYEAYAEEFEETEFYGMLRGIFICEAVPLPKEVSRGCDVFLLQRVKQDLQGQEAEGSVTA